jgi:hypothetical protein
LDITPGQTSVTVEWGQVAGAFQFVLEIANVSGGSPIAPIRGTTVEATEPRIAIQGGLSPNTQYLARVTAQDQIISEMETSDWTLFTTMP